MTGLLILDALYLIVAVVALALTRAEARAREAVDPDRKSVVWGMAGVLACALWPATLAVMAVTILVTARRAAAAQAAEEAGADKTGPVKTGPVAA